MNITIDGQVYDFNTLSEEAKAQINSLQAAEARLVELKRDTAMVMTARSVYAQQLKNELTKFQPLGQATPTGNGELPPSDVQPAKSKSKKAVSEGL